MKPWREIAVPHPDVLEGTFQQSEFAADITAVHTGKATPEYQDAAAFFERTFITEGMRLLLTRWPSAERQGRRAGHPAPNRLRRRQDAHDAGRLSPGYPQVPAHGSARHPRRCSISGLMDVPQARVAVLDGTAHAPGQPWKHGKQTIKTLWGELAWQLGGDEGFALVKEADATGTSPGKDVLEDAA